MKTVLYHGPKDIRLEETAKPTIRTGEVLVKVEAALTGGTDIKTYLRGHPRIIKEIPSSFGYEFAGTITETKATKFQIGDRVVAANTAPCYKCFFCDKSEYELCQNLDFLNGSFAEYIKIPAHIAKHNLYKIADDLSFPAAAMTQTLAVALHGFNKSQIQAGDTVAIYGLGPIGQCFVKLCKHYINDVTVIAIGRSSSKLDLARANGADHIIDTTLEDLNQAIRKICPHGADRVIEAVGKTEIWSQALEIVRPGGLVNFFGGPPKGSTIELDTFKTHYAELTLVGTFHHTPSYIKEALDLIASGRIDMLDLISHKMRLAELEDALKLSIDGKALKILIRP